jgi:hypothetical protein
VTPAVGRVFTRTTVPPRARLRSREVFNAVPGHGR